MCFHMIYQTYILNNFITLSYFYLKVAGYVLKLVKTAG